MAFARWRRLWCGLGPSGEDDRRRNGIGVSGHLPYQHAGNMDGSREGRTNWSGWPHDAWFGGCFNLRLGVCLQHAVGRATLGIDFGVDCRICLRLASGLSLAQDADTYSLNTTNVRWQNVERTVCGIKLYPKPRIKHLSNESRRR